MKVTIGTAEVADGVRHHAHSFRVNHSRTLQVAQFLRAARASVFDRGNIVTQVQFGVDRAFDSKQGALGWLFRHYGLISGTQDVRFEVDNGDGTSTVIECPGAGVSASDGEWQGLCVPVAYQLQVPSIEISEGPALEWEGREVRYRDDITGDIGGASSDLDAIATISKTAGQVAFWVYLYGEMMMVLLLDDPDPGNTVGTGLGQGGNGIVIPVDHDPDTNAKIWQVKK